LEAFAAPTNSISAYKTKEITVTFESWGTPKCLIFRAETGSIRLVMSMKPTKAVDNFGDKRAPGVLSWLFSAQP
jgi:hypothetical protein